jgi:signal transduction histidine kinase
VSAGDGTGSEHRTTAIDTLGVLAEPYLLTDLDGEVLAANRAAQRLFGDAGAPSSLCEVTADEQALREVLQRWRSSATPRPGVLVLDDGRSLRGDGCRLPSAPALVIRLGRPGTGLRTLAGLTAQVHEENLRRRQQELDRSLQRLHAANLRLDAVEAEMREHAGAVAHDVRTPLFTIFGAARRLRSGGHVDDAGTPYLELLLDACAHLHEVTEGMLDVARIDRDRWEPQPVSISEVLTDVLDELKDELDDADAGVVVADLPTIVADPRALRQVLFELISNSISYRAPDRGLRIEITARRQDRWVEIRVDDNGIGVPPGPEDRLFELFQGGTRDTAAQGRGIGLATCRRLVTRWGGTIRCERRSTPGASFVFSARSPTRTDRTHV